MSHTFYNVTTNLSVSTGFRPIPSSDAARAWLLGGQRPPSAIPFASSEAFPLGEWIRGPGVALHFISPRVQKDLQDVGATGWGTYPIALEVKGRRLEGYAGLAVAGRCGPVEADKAIPSLRPGPVLPIPTLVGLYFDHQTWDGSDLFVPEGTTSLIVTEKVWRVLCRFPELTLTDTTKVIQLDVLARRN